MAHHERLWRVCAFSGRRFLSTGLSLATVFALVAACSTTRTTATQPPSPAVRAPRFEVRLEDDRLADSRRDGRLFVVIAKDRTREPRLRLRDTGVDGPVRLARDVRGLSVGTPVVLDASALTFPIASLAELTAGRYFVQAAFDSNVDLRSLPGPGNLYSDVMEMEWSGSHVGPVRLTLNRRVPDEVLPPESEYIRFVKLQSRLLSEFHGRAIFLRAGVILPRDYRRDYPGGYPLRVQVGGFGERYSDVIQMMARDSSFRSAWLAEKSPAMLLVHLDGDGPFGDPYQVDSANHGPYGAAITTELIPHIERTFGGMGRGSARVVTGSSTGGWVSLALQIFYPQFFNGVWAFCPDSVDFRAFQLLNIYEDANAFVNRHGFERPAARDRNGDVRFTMRHELRLENLLGGAADTWTVSGAQWGSWNATYGPRGMDNRPSPLWDGVSGALDRSVLEQWKKYDLRLVLQSRWREVAGALDGKLRIAVGEADNYFLNNAVHLLDEFLQSSSPRVKYRITYGAGQGHCWRDITEEQLLNEMREAMAGGD